MQVGISRALQHVADVGPRKEQPPRKERLGAGHPEPLVEQDGEHRESNPERVYRAAPKEQQAMIRLQPVPPDEPPHPLAAEGGHLDPPPHAPGIPKHDLPHRARR
ncbi:MAG: hypothetical protein ACRDGP_06260 [Actinomycetota bacterium]